ncbi:MAG: T9SS type A sorting domain-containing protein [Flavobacteriales bacterium]|jgi:hypothetical protein|nr:T9SS type A sorting domain-containing protein [Flavobacteriales bacterium]
MAAPLHRLALVAVLGGTTMLATAQPYVDITLVPVSAGQLEVRLRPDGPFNEFFAASVFTIRWPDQGGAGLGTIAQPGGTAVYHAVARSGPEHVADGHRYQVFAGFGGATMGDAGASWAAHEEVVICTIEVINGPGGFELVNDDWAEAHNGLFYISLNGLDRTGVVYASGGLSVPDEAAGRITVAPNPSSDGTFEVRWGGGDAAHYTVTDARGRVVRQGRLAASAGEGRLLVDLRGEAPGAYLLTLAGGRSVRTHRLVLVGQGH